MFWKFCFLKIKICFGGQLGEKILSYDSTPRVPMSYFLCQHSDSKRFSYSSKRIFVTVWFAVIAITITTINNYTNVIIITIILIKNSNDNIFKKKLKKKDFSPTVPKSLWLGLGLNLGPSSFLHCYLTI